MKIKELLGESSNYLYHATLTKNVPSIMKQGLMQFQPSNWVRRDGERYNTDAGLFAFEHPVDAVNWAQKMQFNFKDDTSIIRVKTSDLWKLDPSNDPNLMFGQGKAMKSQSDVSVNDIVDVFNVSDFGNPMTMNKSRDDWLKDISKKLIKEGYSGYIAYVLDKPSRDALAKKYPPQYPEWIGHHITYSMKVALGVPEQPRTVNVIGRVNTKGLEALIVEIDGSTKRVPDGGTNHITWSLDRSQGFKPFHSNEVIKTATMEPCDPPIAINVTPQIVK